MRLVLRAPDVEIHAPAARGWKTSQIARPAGLGNSTVANYVTGERTRENRQLAKRGAARLRASLTTIEQRVQSACRASYAEATLANPRYGLLGPLHASTCAARSAGGGASAVRHAPAGRSARFAGLRNRRELKDQVPWSAE